MVRSKRQGASWPETVTPRRLLNDKRTFCEFSPAKLRTNAVLVVISLGVEAAQGKDAESCFPRRWIKGQVWPHMETANCDRPSPYGDADMLTSCDDFVLACSYQRQSPSSGPARIEGFVIARGVLCARYSGR